jgi:hypothetical protein
LVTLALHEIALWRFSLEPKRFFDAKKGVHAQDINSSPEQHPPFPFLSSLSVKSGRSSVGSTSSKFSKTLHSLFEDSVAHSIVEHSTASSVRLPR